MSPAHNPSMRASDGDRERVAAALREHCGEGRLSIEEFRERLEALYDAKTLGDLDRLTEDLPEEDLYQLPVPASKRYDDSTPAGRGSLAGRGPVGVDRRRHNLPAAWGTWLTVNLALAVIWVISMVAGGGLEWSFPWWVWVAGPWGAILVGRTINDRYFRG